MQELDDILKVYIIQCIPPLLP